MVSERVNCPEVGGAPHPCQGWGARAACRYIFRTTLASFALVLVSLTGVIWITQALRGIDLMTSQGQTILTFLGVTSLAIPVLVFIIAPIALMIAVEGSGVGRREVSETVAREQPTPSPHYIAGEWLIPANLGNTPVFNPSTGDVIAECPAGGAVEVNAAVEAAHARHPPRSRLPPPRRRGLPGSPLRRGRRRRL
eukprot:gene32051-42769_t